MSQFLLVRPDRERTVRLDGLTLARVERSDDFVRRAAEQAFGTIQGVWTATNVEQVLERDQAAANSTSATGAPPEEPLLHRDLRALAGSGASFVLFYGCDLADLPTFGDVEALIGEVRRQALDPRREVYARFEAGRDDRRRTS